MKFCENCGTKLADNIVFCEECGAKQVFSEDVKANTMSVEYVSETKADFVVEEKYTKEDTVKHSSEKLSEICEPAKREIKSWVLAILLVVFSPYFLMFDMVVLGSAIVTSLPFMNEYIFWLCEIFVLLLMWKRSNWNLIVKLLVIGMHIIAYL